MRKPPHSTQRRQVLQGLAALSAASLLPSGAFASPASTLNALPRTALVIGIGQQTGWKYWVAPDKVNRSIALETWWRKGGRMQRSDRLELESHTRG